jgi:hypothetical protein
MPLLILRQAQLDTAIEVLQHQDPDAYETQAAREQLLATMQAAEAGSIDITGQQMLLLLSETTRDLTGQQHLHDIVDGEVPAKQAATLAAREDLLNTVSAYYYVFRLTGRLGS